MFTPSRNRPSGVRGGFAAPPAATSRLMLVLAASVGAAASMCAAAASLPPSGANPERLAVPAPPPAVEPPPLAVLPAPLVAATRADLLRRLGRAAREATPELVVRESVVWRDGSLGCARPGAKYTMALVPGWRLVWRAAGRDWAYHASRRGAFVYCEHPGEPVSRGDTASDAPGSIRPPRE